MLVQYGVVALLYFGTSLAVPNNEKCINGLCHPGQICQVTNHPAYCRDNSAAPKCYPDEAKCISTSDCCNCTKGVQCLAGICQKPCKPVGVGAQCDAKSTCCLRGLNCVAGTCQKLTPPPPPCTPDGASCLAQSSCCNPVSSCSNGKCKPPSVITSMKTSPTQTTPACIRNGSHCTQQSQCCDKSASCLANICVSAPPPLYGPTTTSMKSPGMTSLSNSPVLTTHPPLPPIYTAPPPPESTSAKAPVSTSPPPPPYTSTSPPPVYTSTKSPIFSNCIPNYGKCTPHIKCCDDKASCTGGHCIAPLQIVYGPDR